MTSVLRNLKEMTSRFSAAAATAVLAVACSFNVQAELVNARGNVSLSGANSFFAIQNASDGVITSQWVTDAPNGGAGDYFSGGVGPAVLTFDLGRNFQMDAAAFWAYAQDNPAANRNSVSEFSLLFATEAEGAGAFGSSIAFNPTYNPAHINQSIQQDFVFGQSIKARYVQMTITDNYYEAGNVGGDRVGFSDLQFDATIPIPEPGDWISAEGNVTETTPGGGVTELFPIGNASDHFAGQNSRWVSNARNGATGDFFAAGPDPVLVLDLGEMTNLDALRFFSYWNDPNSTAINNSASLMSVRFGTEEEGIEGIGDSIAFNPLYELEKLGSATPQDFEFNEIIRARYVELTLLDNFYNGVEAGGDRVGFSDVQLRMAVPEPTTMLMFFGLAGLATTRRQRG